METSYQQPSFSGGPPPVVASSFPLTTQPTQAHPSHRPAYGSIMMQPAPSGPAAQFLTHTVNPAYSGGSPYMQPPLPFSSHAAHGGAPILSRYVQPTPIPIPPPPYLNSPVELRLNQENEQLKRKMRFFQHVHDTVVHCYNNLLSSQDRESSSATVNVVLSDSSSSTPVSVTCWRSGLKGNIALLNKEQELEKYKALLKSLNDGATAVVNNPEPTVSTITFPHLPGELGHPLHHVDAVLYPKGEYQKHQELAQRQSVLLEAACQQAELDVANHATLPYTISLLKSKAQEKEKTAHLTSKKHDECKAELAAAQKKIKELKKKLSTYETRGSTGPKKISITESSSSSPVPKSNRSSPVSSPVQSSPEEEVSSYKPGSSDSSAEESRSSSSATSKKRKRQTDHQASKRKRKKRKRDGMDF